MGESELEGIAQRIALRGYLEAFDYEETCRYVRTQMYCAGLDWDTGFEPECDAVVFSLTEGVPRLINQLCDQAMRLAEQGMLIKSANMTSHLHGGTNVFRHPPLCKVKFRTQIYVHMLMSQSNPVRHLQQKLNFLGKKWSRKAVWEDIESAVVEFELLGKMTTKKTCR